MLLKQLGYLVALGRECHFGRAAAQCGITQPALSSAIKQLEKELGVPIVLRHQRFQGFTPEGQRVLDWAGRILADREALRQEIGEMRGHLHGRLRLGVVPSALPLAPRLTEPFCRRHPDASVRLMSMSSIEIQQALDNFELDVGITYLDNEPILRVVATPLYRERYCLLFPDDGRFRNRRAVTWKEAAELDLCLLSPDMQNRRIVDAAFRRAGCAPVPHVETNSISNLALHVATGRWSSIVPEHFLHTLPLAPGTRALPLVEPDVGHDVGAVVAGQEPVPPMAKAMLAVVEELKRLGAPIAGPAGGAARRRRRR